MGTQPPIPKGAEPTQFSAHVYSGQMDQDATWYEGMPRPTRHCVRCGPSYTQKKGHTHPHSILAHVYCGQVAGWMKTPLGAKVDLGPGHIVLDGVPAPSKGAQQPPSFSAHVYCGHGRPSHLLLSSCYFCIRERSRYRRRYLNNIDSFLGLWCMSTVKTGVTGVPLRPGDIQNCRILLDFIGVSSRNGWEGSSFFWKALYLFDCV